MTDDEADIIAKKRGYWLHSLEVWVGQWTGNIFVYLIERLDGARDDPLLNGTMYLSRQIAAEEILKQHSEES